MFLRFLLSFLLSNNLLVMDTGRRTLRFGKRFFSSFSPKAVGGGRKLKSKNVPNCKEKKIHPGCVRLIGDDNGDSNDSASKHGINNHLPVVATNHETKATLEKYVLLADKVYVGL